jgi:hypothetical protein
MMQASVQPLLDRPKITPHHLNLMGYVDKSEVNGPGCRAVLWVQGCARHCPNCFNPASWSFEINQLISVKDLTFDRPYPRLFTRKWFRWGIFGLFMSVFISRLIATEGNLIAIGGLFVSWIAESEYIRDAKGSVSFLSIATMLTSQRWAFFLDRLINCEHDYYY